MSVPERRITGWDMADALAAHLAAWLPLRDPAGSVPGDGAFGQEPGDGTYLYAAATRRGIPLVTRALLPTSIEPARAFADRPEDRAPYVRVVAGPAEVVDRDGDAITLAEYTVEVYVVVVEDTARRTTEVLTCYEDAVVACLEQQRVAGADDCWWLGGGDGPEVADPRDRERTRQGRVDVFVVHASDVLALTGGPASPTDPLPAGYPADDVELDVDADRMSTDPDDDPEEEFPWT